MYPTPTVPGRETAPPGVDHPVRGALPRPVTVALGQRSIPTVAYAVRVTRRGHQTLVSLGGHRWWIPSSRVTGRAEDAVVEEAA
jgi:hypothetical protein